MFTLNIILLFLLILIIVYLIPKFSRWNYIRLKLNKFPGPKGYPIVGNLDVVFFGDRKALYLRGLKLANDYGKNRVSKGWLINLPFVSVYRPEEIENVLSSTININKSVVYNVLTPWLGTGLLTSTGTKWHQRRKMLTPAFHFNILKKFLVVFIKESKHLVEVLQNQTDKEVDIIPIISKFTLNTISETAMGTPLESLVGPEYYRSIYDIGEICIARISKPWFFLQCLYFFAPTYWRQCAIIKYLHKFSMDIITRRKEVLSSVTNVQEESNDDSYSKRKQFAMLDILLSVQKESGAIEDEGIREEVDTFMFEGHDTTSIALVHTLMQLANNKIHQDKIYAEIISVLGENCNEPTYPKLKELKYMEMCIKETLRLHPSVPIIARQLDADVETSTGNNIPADCTCLIPIFSIHRNPDFFPNPGVFDPGRFSPENTSKRHPFAYIPFSAGPRNCIGQKFAMMELKCAITEILRNFILEPVDTPETIEYYFDIVLRPAKPIRVKFMPRTRNT